MTITRFLHALYIVQFVKAMMKYLTYHPQVSLIRSMLTSVVTRERGSKITRYYLYLPLNLSSYVYALFTHGDLVLQVYEYQIFLGRRHIKKHFVLRSHGSILVSLWMLKISINLSIIYIHIPPWWIGACSSKIGV